MLSVMADVPEPLTQTLADIPPQLAVATPSKVFDETIVSVPPTVTRAWNVLLEFMEADPATVTLPVKTFEVSPELIVSVPDPVVAKVLSKVLLLPVIVVLPPNETAPTA